MKNFTQEGMTIEVTAAADINSGDPIKVSDMVAVAVNDIANGEKGVAYTTGVFELPCVAANVIEVGATVYLNSSGVITTTETSNTLAGKAWTASPNGVAIVEVKINV